MTGIRIGHGVRVIVADGRKALLLCNEGSALDPELRLEKLLEAPPNPPTHEQGSDAPGRAMVPGRKSAVGQTDWHQRGEERFVADAAKLLGQICLDRDAKGLIVAAPPKALADIRKALPKALRPLIVAEFDKDLTKLPIDEIESHLV
jgi:protein required for attachment to host cells